jgi:RND family efflux transporter MFP subunit
MTGAGDRREALRADLEALRLDRTAPVPRRRRRRVLLPALLLVLVAGGAAVWALANRTTSVRVARAERIQATAPPRALLSGSGYVVTGERYISLGTRVPGRIDRYFVEEGQAVRKGDPLVQLDDREYQAAVERSAALLARARADRELAEAELRRGRRLREESVISEREIDLFENKARVARAAVAELEAAAAQAKVNLEYTRLRAPSDGVVLAKLKEVGEIAVPGGFAGSGDLVRLANMTDLRAEVDVNEVDLAQVRLGQPAEVIPDAYPGDRYRASVVKLYPQVDRQKGTLKVEVRILEPDAKLLPDMSARVTFLGEPSGKTAGGETIAIPAAAVRRESDGRSFVWVVDDGLVRRAAIETAPAEGDRTWVTNGLSGGESVVVSADGELADGERVKIQAAG